MNKDGKNKGEINNIRIVCKLLKKLFIQLIEQVWHTASVERSDLMIIKERVRNTL